MLLQVKYRVFVFEPRLKPANDTRIERALAAD
jgi:hypothetical protein